MKKIILIAIAFCCVLQKSQAQNWLWMKHSNEIITNPIQKVVEGIDIAADDSGNAIITGFSWAHSTIFGTDTLVNTNGWYNAFAAKYDRNGNSLWAVGANPNDTSQGWRVATDHNGNVLITGTFESDSITIDNVTIFSDHPPGSGFQDSYIYKLDKNGNCLWAKTFGGYETPVGDATFDNNGNIILTGFFTVPFMTVDNDTLFNSLSPYFEIYLIKLDLNGNLIWSKSFGGAQSDEGSAVAVDSLNNIYLTGDYLSSSMSVDTILLTNIGGRRFFISKFNESGNVIWAKSAQGISDQYSKCISVDNEGNSYVTGLFTNGNIILDNYTLTNPNIGLKYFSFLAKYNSSGYVIWAKNIRMGKIYSISSFGNNRIYVSGGFSYVSPTIFSDTIKFDSILVNKPPLSKDPMFIATVDSNGNVLCIDAVNSGGDDENSISASKTGEVYLGGDFYVYNFILGSDTFHQDTSQYGVGEQLFIAKYECLPVGESVFILKSNSDFSLYPNPFSIQFTLELKSISNISIYNLLGEKLIEIKNASGILQLGEELSSGMYLLEIKNADGETAVKKIVKVE